MSQMNKKNERVFTLELRSKGDVKSVSLDGDQKVSIEGTLGKLRRARFVDGTVLEVVGSKGELRVDLGPNDLKGPKDEGNEVKGGSR
jgi:hypothetical protein